MTVTYDSNGVPMRFQATITEQYPNISRVRESSETRRPARDGAGRRTGVVHDKAPDQSYDGGHAAGHQFFPGLGRDNMFPQESGFNRHVYTQLESEMAVLGRTPTPTSTWTSTSGSPATAASTSTQSYDVDGDTVQQVPDRVTVSIVYSDADGNPLRTTTRSDFDNVAGPVAPGPARRPLRNGRSSQGAASER